MSIHKELDYNKEIYNIKHIQFSISSPESIKKKSVVKVSQPLLYDSHGEPIINGLFDPRMGVLDYGKICPTDELDNRFCPGYFGHIELIKPVCHYQFLDITMKTLKSYCIRCSCVLLNKEDEIEKQNMKKVLKLKNKKRWNYYYPIVSKNRTCFNCGFVQPTKFSKEGVAKIYGEWKETQTKEHLSSERILRIFRKISEEDLSLLGFSEKWCKPEWLICTVLPVPPPAVRPSIKQMNGQRSEDDITHKLVDILKTNNTLEKKLENKNTSNDTINGFWDLLQYHVATLIDNDIPNVNVSCHRSGRPLKSTVQRLKGKEGRIRGNLMGKRVDFSARTVITPDPNIKISELGVPLKICMNLTFPAIVNKYSLDKLTEYVRTGPFEYPGANSIKRFDGSTISLRYVDRNSIVLDTGDIVNRHLIDGDFVLFNRQPSLHKMSMMVHEVKAMPYNTFRLNTSVTKPYNADFDGDEMNLHAPQSSQTRIELSKLARVQSQIISPRMNSPIIVLVQDTLLGSYRITNDGVYFTEKEMMEMMITIKSFDGNLPEPEINENKYKRWSGRQLITLILPPLNLNMSNKSYENNPTKLNMVKINDGNLLQGILDKKIINSGTSGLIHTIFNDYGEKRCQQFLDNIQDIITKYLLITGFSVGISDLIADEQTKKEMQKVIVNNKKEVNEVIQHVHLNIFENSGGKPNNEEFEDKINNILNKTSSRAGSIGLKSLDINNRMTNMVSAGSKGSEINVAQMISCLGQQNVDGKRIPYGFVDRTLPHFSRYDDSPEARGFVEQSFIKGLTPIEFFFHAMGGREGLIDTAVKTSETGYIQRKLIKAMEDLKIHYDLSVKNSYNKIIQFLYGEDGYNYSKIESQKLDLLSLKFDEIEDKYRFNDNEEWELFLEEDIYNDLINVKNYKDILEKHYNEIYDLTHLLRNYIFKNYLGDNINYPINLFRLINQGINLFNIENDDLTDLSPLYVLDELKKLESILKKDNMDDISVLFKILLYSYLSPKKIIKDKRINKMTFDYIINMIKLKYKSLFIPVGEMVGVIAAQSIGEPATQMTLNTFHFAGVGSKSNVTRGVPRLKELLHISKNIKKPSVTIYCKDEYCYDRIKTQNIGNKLELTILKDFVLSTSIYFDPSDEKTEINEDEPFMDIYKIFREVEDIEEEDDNPWVIRLDINRKELMNKDISMEDIHHAIFSNFDRMGYYSDDNAEKIIFRMRINMENSKNDDRDIQYLKLFEKNLLNIVVKGIDNINKVILRQSKNNIIYQDGDYINKDIWVLDTDGTNLRSVLSQTEIDESRTYSNDIRETYDILGIAAAKQLLFHEINEVIDFSGNYVNYRHISLLCNFMTNKGILMSIDRFGINRDLDIGPLAKCSFEETTEQIFKAAIFGEIDNLDGVSSNIMMGQLIPSGTGDTSIILDEMKLLNVKRQLIKEEDTSDDETYCDNNLGFDIDIDNINPE